MYRRKWFNIKNKKGLLNNLQMKIESEKVKNKYQLKHASNSNHMKALSFTLLPYILISRPTNQISQMPNNDKSNISHGK